VATPSAEVAWTITDLKTVSHPPGKRCEKTMITRMFAVEGPPTLGRVEGEGEER